MCQHLELYSIDRIPLLLKALPTLWTGFHVKPLPYSTIISIFVFRRLFTTQRQLFVTISTSNLTLTLEASVGKRNNSFGWVCIHRNSGCYYTLFNDMFWPLTSTLGYITRRWYLCFTIINSNPLFNNVLWQQKPFTSTKIILAYCYSQFLIFPQFDVILWHHRPLTTIPELH